MKKNYNVSISEFAIEDIQRVAKWYEQNSKGLGVRFITEIQKEKEQLRTDPKAFQIRYDEVRILFLRTFPYGLHYIIRETQIIVVSVFGTSQDSDKWNPHE